MRWQEPWLAVHGGIIRPSYRRATDSLRRHRLKRQWPTPPEPEEADQPYKPPTGSETLSAIEFTRLIRTEIVGLIAEAKKRATGRRRTRHYEMLCTRLSCWRAWKA